MQLYSYSIIIIINSKERYKCDLDNSTKMLLIAIIERVKEFNKQQILTST